MRPIDHINTKLSTAVRAKYAAHRDLASTNNEERCQAALSLIQAETMIAVLEWVLEDSAYH